MGLAISGLTADGRVLCKYMRNECLNHRWEPPVMFAHATACGKRHALGLLANRDAESDKLHSPVFALRYVYESPLPVGRLVRQVADKHQVRVLEGHTDGTGHVREAWSA